MQTHYTNTTPAGTADISGKEYLFFSGFSYLGLHSHPDFKATLKEGIDRFGTVFVSSRIANTRLQLYDELEHSLAVRLQQQSSATFPSGYLASQAAAQYAASQGELLYAPGAHPSLYTGRVSIPTQDWQSWAALTLDKVNAHTDHTFVIVADGVNPLTSTINDFSWLQQVQRQVLVLIDDSHGFGVIGDNGSGIISQLPKHAPVRYLIASSLAKAYSTQGGVVAGHAGDIAAVKKLPLFTGATPMMPANVWAFLQSTTLQQSQYDLLQQRIAYFGSRILITPLAHNPFRLPMFLLQPGEQIPQHLLEHDIMISSFGYPYPDSTPINRIIVSAHHTEKQLDTLYHILMNK